MLDDIIGQDDTIEYLETLVECRDEPEKFPSTLLLSGPSGVGKFTSAVEFAKELNCRSESCQGSACSSCKRVEQRDHSDVLFFTPEGRSLKIDKIRQLLREASTKQFSGQWKVFIIEDTHLITPEGADALLKTIEDGIESTIFLFLTNRKSEVVDTIVSRSIELEFSPLSEDHIASILSIDPSEHETALRLSRGSLDRATFFLEGEGFEIRDKVLGFIKGLSRGIPDYKTVAFLDDLDEDEWVFLEVFYSAVRDLLLMTEDSSHSDILNADKRNVLIEIAENLDQDGLLDGKEEIERMMNREHIPTQDRHLLKDAILNFSSEINE